MHLRHYLSIIKRLSVLFFISMGLGACDNLMGDDLSDALLPGSRLVMKTTNGVLSADLVSAENGFRKWNISLNDRTAFSFKSYRGLINVAVSEGSFQYWNEYQFDGIDEHFPLEVGKEFMLNGTRHMRRSEAEIPFWLHVSVRDKSHVRLDEEDFEVLIVDMVTERNGPNGVLRENKTVWYSPKLQMELRSEGERNGEKFSNKIIRIERASPENQPRRRRGLGTVSI